MRPLSPPPTLPTRPRKGLLLLLELLWGQDVAVGVQWGCPDFTPQLESLQLSQFLYRPDNHLVLPVLIHEDRGTVDEGQEAVLAHPGGWGDGGLCWGAAVGPGVRQPAPHVAIIGPVGPGGKGGRQTAHIEPCVKAPRVLWGVLPGVDESATHLRLDFRAGRRPQRQPVLGLLGEAGTPPGLVGDEELTLSPRLGGQEGLAGMGHLGRDKRESGGLLCFSLPGAAAETRGRILIRSLVVWPKTVSIPALPQKFCLLCRSPLGFLSSALPPTLSPQLLSVPFTLYFTRPLHSACPHPPPPAPAWDLCS